MVSIAAGSLTMATRDPVANDLLREAHLGE
jgi:hypothetical protein